MGTFNIAGSPAVTWCLKPDLRGAVILAPHGVQCAESQVVQHKCPLNHTPDLNRASISSQFTLAAEPLQGIECARALEIILRHYLSTCFEVRAGKKAQQVQQDRCYLKYVTGMILQSFASDLRVMFCRLSKGHIEGQCQSVLLD